MSKALNWAFFICMNFSLTYNQPMNQMTPTPVPLGTLDVDSVAVLKSHLPTVFLISLIIILLIFFVIPKCLKAYNKKLELEEKRMDAETKILQSSLEKIVKAQENVNSALIERLNSLEKGLTDIKDIFVNSLKSGLHVFILFLVVSSVACEPDTLTFYKFKPKEVPAVVEHPKVPDKIEVIVKPELNADEPKSCPGGCSPPKSTCNTKTGKCEGKAFKNKDYRPETSDMTFFTEKYGAIDSGIPQWQK